jgi:hypothetical protein
MSPITRREIEPDLLPGDELDAVAQSASRLYQKVTDDRASGKDTWTLCESVWPALGHGAKSATIAPNDPGLALIPLDRLGAPPGHAGSHVLIGYFFDRGNPDLYCSQPLVLKTLKISGAPRDKLLEEANNARSLRPYTAYYKDAYAIPIHFDEADGTCDFSVLWSPLKTYGRPIHSRDSLTASMKARAFLELLRRPSPDEARDHLKRTFDLLLPLHRRCGTSGIATIDLLKEYRYYLRDMDQPTPMTQRWHRTWNPPHEMRCGDFGREWINPFWVTEELRRLAKTTPACLGAVHGDIHPRNIMLSEDGGPCIIDFGWADDNAHIAKDFGLMESNLWFMTLRPDVGFDDLQRLHAFVHFGGAGATLGNDYLDGRVSLIHCIRESAKTHFVGTPDWDVEYLVPLFLIAFGLLSLAEFSDNVTAARLFVLNLGYHVASQILPHLAAK